MAKKNKKRGNNGIETKPIVEPAAVEQAVAVESVPPAVVVVARWPRRLFRQ